MFIDYPDVCNIEEVGEMIGASHTMIYRLIKSNSIEHFRVGNHIRITKQAVIDYIIESCKEKRNKEH